MPIEMHIWAIHNLEALLWRMDRNFLPALCATSNDSFRPISRCPVAHAGGSGLSRVNPHRQPCSGRKQRVELPLASADKRHEARIALRGRLLRRQQPSLDFSSSAFHYSPGSERAAGKS